MSTRQELVASDLTVEEICAFLGADSLGYVSLDGLVEAGRLPEGRLLPGVLRRRVPDPHPRTRGKFVLEEQLPSRTAVSDAYRRPVSTPRRPRRPSR